MKGVLGCKGVEEMWRLVFETHYDHPGDSCLLSAVVDLFIREQEHRTCSLGGRLTRESSQGQEDVKWAWEPRRRSPNNSEPSGISSIDSHAELHVTSSSVDTMHLNNMNLSRLTATS